MGSVRVNQSQNSERSGLSLEGREEVYVTGPPARVPDGFLTL
jgi:hypothetical protein